MKIAIDLDTPIGELQNELNSIYELTNKLEENLKELQCKRIIDIDGEIKIKVNDEEALKVLKSKIEKYYK